MRFREFGKLSLILMLILSSVSCVLKKRDQPPKKDDSAKTDTGPTPMKGIPMTNAPGNLDQQGQMDLETFYHPRDVESVENDAQTTETPQWKRLTGHKLDLQNQKDAAYTDASPDLLVDKIRIFQRDNNISKEQKQRSFDFAKQIKNIKILDSRGTIFTVLVQYEAGNYRVKNRNTVVDETKKDKTEFQTKRLSGAALNDGRYANLAETQPHPSSDKSTMKAVLRCLDQNFQSNKCGTYLLHITKTNADSTEAQADVIIRMTAAKIVEVKTPQDRALSDKSIKLADLFNKTYEDHYFEEKLVKMYNLTVVEGISEFKLELITNKEESISVGGPLITGIGNALPLKYPLAKNPDFKVFNAPNKIATDITDLFDVALLNYNNGRGKIKITFENAMVGEDPSKQSVEEVTVTLINQTSPLVKLSKETIYFNPEQ